MHMQCIGENLYGCIQLCPKYLILYHIRKSFVSGIGRCKHLEKSALRKALTSCLKSWEKTQLYLVRTLLFTHSWHKRGILGLECLPASCFSLT